MKGEKKELGSGLSRRNFLKLSTGAITAVPAATVAALTPSVALADEPKSESFGGIISESKTVGTTNGSKIQIVVYDMSLEEPAAIDDALVVLISKDTGANVSGTTKDGSVTLDIRDLAYNPNGVSITELHAFSFVGQVIVKCNGYRDFESSTVWISGGSVVEIPTRKSSVDSDLPYPYRISIEDWDILYTNNSFFLYEETDHESELYIEFHNVKSKTNTATIEFKTKGVREPIVSNTVNVIDGVAIAKFKEKFFVIGSEKQLGYNKSFMVLIHIDDYSYSVNVHLGTDYPVLPTPKSHSDDSKSFNPITGSKNSLFAGYTFESWAGPLEGVSIKPSWPDFRYGIYIDPSGTIQIWKKSQPVGKKYNGEKVWMPDQGPDKALGDKMSDEKWAYSPVQAAKKNHEWNSKVLEHNVEKFGDRWGPGLSTANGIDAVKNYEYWYQYDFGAVLKYSTSKWTAQGNIYFRLAGYLKWNYSIQFSVLWIPLVFTVGADASAEVQFKLGMAVEVPKEKNPSRGELINYIFSPEYWNFDFNNSGMNLNFEVALWASLGVGFRALQFISMKARVYLVLFFGFDPFSYNEMIGTIEEIESKVAHFPIPHVTIDVGFEVSVTVDCWFFTVSKTLWKSKNARVYDSWKAVDWNFLPQADDPIDLLSLADNIDLSEMSIVTDAMLAKYSEGTIDSLSGAADYESFDWETERQTDIVSPMVDGTQIKYAVYNMPQYDDSAEEVIALGNANSDEAIDLDATATKKSRLNLFSPTTLTSFNNGLTSMSEDVFIDKPSISGIGKFGGLRPSVHFMINESDNHVIGDPRMRVVEYATKSADGSSVLVTACFRICSVMINGKARTRVIMTILDAKTALGENVSPETKAYIEAYRNRILDFDINDLPEDSGIKREDLYDYEFAVQRRVCYEPNDLDLGFDTLQLVIISGTRPDGDESQIADVATSTIITYLAIPALNLYKDTLVYEWKRSVLASKALMLQDDTNYHMISHVWIQGGDTFGDEYALVAFLDRYGANKNDLIKENSNNVNVTAGFLIVDYGIHDYVVPQDDLIKLKTADYTSDSSVRGLVLSPLVDGYYSLALQGRSADNYTKNYYYLLSIQKDASGAHVFDAFMYGGVHSVTLIPWLDQNCFLAAYPDTSGNFMENVNDKSKRALHKVWWDTEIPNKPVMCSEPVGPSEFTVEDFEVNTTGTYVFWCRAREKSSDGNEPDLYVTPEWGTDIDDSGYQIMACRIRDGVFSDPFVVADVERNLDGMALVAGRSKYSPLAVVYKNKVDTGEKDKDGNPIYPACDLWYLSVPNLKSAIVTDCELVSDTIIGGCTSLFDVKIQNYGNTYLSGCSLQLYRHFGDDAIEVEGAFAALTFGKDNMMPSGENPTDEEGKFIDAEQDNALAPGKSATYRVEFAIPESWDSSADAEISIVASIPVMAEHGGLSGQAEDEVVFEDFNAAPGEYRPDPSRSTGAKNPDAPYMAVVSPQNTSYNSALSDAPVLVGDHTMMDDPEKPVNTGQNAPEDAGDSKDSNAESVDNGRTNGATVNGASANSKNGTSANSGRTATAKTLDTTLSSLPATIAALGTAALAYSLRRSKNENLKSSDE